MSRKPNILFLVHRVPFPPNRGDRIRSYHMLKHLSEQGNVYLATLADEPLEAGTEETLQAMCSQVAIQPIGRGRWLNGILSLASGWSATEGLFKSNTLRAKIKQWSDDIAFDTVVVFCSSMVQYLDAAGLRNVRTIVDLIDVDSQKFFDYAKHARGPKRWLYHLEASRLRRIECSLPHAVDAITLVTQAEAELYQSFCPNDKTHVIGNGVDLEYFKPMPGREIADRCVFVGAMDYPPNIDGVQWFCKEVWPLIRADRPKATFAIVGRNPTPSVQRLSSIPGVEVIGTVPDVRPYLAEAMVVVVPLRIARGVQNKVLEAMAMGKVVVASHESVFGLSAALRTAVLMPDCDSSWHRTVLNALTIHSDYKDCSMETAKTIHRSHKWSAVLQALNVCLEHDAINPHRITLAGGVA